ncbi:MAG: hypothetical protein ACRDKB_01150 [Actinomycetota bacterium]
MLKAMRHMRSQAGVAMVTVLFVGSTLAVVGTTASFLTIQEFRAGNADRKASQALSYAEAGIDRFLLAFRQGEINLNMAYGAGCEYTNTVDHPWLVESGNIGNGTFRAELSVVDCDNRPALDSHGTLDEHATIEAKITSTGQFPAAKRVVEQRIEISPLGLPIGVFADSMDANGTGSINQASVMTRGDFTGRDKVGFRGLDPYYFEDDFYGNGEFTPIPAAAHAAGTISRVQGGGTPEHPPSPNCSASILDDPGQSGWDGDNWTTDEDEAAVTTTCSGQSDHPPTSLFTAEDLENVIPKPTLDEDDFAALKEAAKSSGIYCQISQANSVPKTHSGSCKRFGTTISPPQVWQDGDIPVGSPNQFIFYVDFVGGDPLANEIRFKTEWRDCSYTPALHKSAIFVMRNGGLTFQNGAFVNGAIIAYDGEVDSQGSYTFHGSIIAKKFWYRGNATIKLSECWVDNMPGPFLRVELAGWREVDR